MCTCFNLNISLPQEKEEKRLGRIEAAFRKLIISTSAFYVEFLLEKSLLADLSILIDYLIHSSWVQVNL